ncbi:lipopolysaccharide biosynthesis protein [Chryseobacterium sp. 6424]|uniref:glycosyl transferase family 90 n=1 Tax=Chryseobacterium sp. 6424 TaxID=2039166 RepID=UPI000EFCC0CC|nr:glycosyl transferase family 90 [Chryseobacterium sp. 6424]AYO58345.1 lipopolysaccharide biosynthesis protein [Chryseobacterium sp. 6424]
MTKVVKENKFSFYLKGYSRGFIPVKTAEKKIEELYKALSSNDIKKAEARVDYYNKIDSKVKTVRNGTKIEDLLNPRSKKVYYFDTFEFARYFPKDNLIDFAFGDVNTILDIPTITKSRPIHGDNANNILMNLNKVRHFISVRDSLKFSAKKNLMVGRAAVHQKHRIKFYEQYFNHPLCDLGQINKNGGNPQMLKPKISIEEHLKYKFILSLEGNDVASNLKWIMSSNSIAISPPLKMETWYMEGTLVPNEHFICINEDYTNLEERLHYYLDHENECRNIIENAQEYRKQFDNKNAESLISLLVLKKYFKNIQ